MLKVLPVDLCSASIQSDRGHSGCHAALRSKPSTRAQDNDPVYRAMAARDCAETLTQASPPRQYRDGHAPRFGGALRTRPGPFRSQSCAKHHQQVSPRRCEAKIKCRQPRQRKTVHRCRSRGLRCVRIARRHVEPPLIDSICRANEYSAFVR